MLTTKISSLSLEPTGFRNRYRVPVETQQCLCLHVAAALQGKVLSLAEVQSAALPLRQEILRLSVQAFAHLGDAPPHVGEAEAFVRHNAHDCFYPHHEKDYRSLALFVPGFFESSHLVLRVSQAGRLEGDLVKGKSAPKHFGGVVMHRGHVRMLELSTRQFHQLLEALEQSGRFREVEVEGWGAFLDRTDELGELEAVSLRLLPQTPGTL